MDGEVPVARVAGDVSAECIVGRTLADDAGIEYGAGFASLQVTGKRISAFRGIGEFAGGEHTAAREGDQAHGGQADTCHPLKAQHGTETFREQGNLFDKPASSLPEIVACRAAFALNFCLSDQSFAAHKGFEEDESFFYKGTLSRVTSGPT